GDAVAVARGGAGEERGGPDPGGHHAGRGHAEADGAVGDHVGVHVLLLAHDRQREQEGGDVEADEEQEGSGGAELVDSCLFHLWWLSWAGRLARGQAKAARAGRARRVGGPRGPEGAAWRGCRNAASGGCRRAAGPPVAARGVAGTGRDRG